MMRLTVNVKPMGTRRATTNETGQVLALFALFLVVFVGFAALTIDYGSWLKARRDYQNAADSAALAGSAFLSRPIDATKQRQARQAAWQSLQQQLGLALDPNNPSLSNNSTQAGTPVVDSGYNLWVSTPPIDATTKYPGAFTGATDRYLFVWVEKANPAFFARIFGQANQTVSAWATAGQFPGRFAVITLRKNGQAGPANATDIDLNGSNSTLTVLNGDVGGNWGMKLNASSNLYLPDAPSDSQAYLIDNVSCGNSCWSPQQVNSGPPSNTIKSVLPLPQPIDDPNYPLPLALTGLPATGGTATVPKGPGTDAQGDITINKGAVSGVGCAANSPKLGPGWYRNIIVQNSSCVLLDPLNNYATPNSLSPVGTPIGSNQQPGIYYITGALNVNANALVVGDGVSVVFLPGGNNDGLIVGSQGVVDLNTGASDRFTGYPPDLHKAAFQTDGSYSYSWGASGPWTYTANNADNSKVGVTIYVAKPSQYGNNVADANTNVIKINSGGGLAWQGVTYAPHDNIQFAGQPNHDGIGQFVSWTFQFAGGTEVTQVYDGPDNSTPHLVEPHLGQ